MCVFPKLVGGRGVRPFRPGRHEKNIFFCGFPYPVMIKQTLRRVYSRGEAGKGLVARASPRDQMVSGMATPRAIFWERGNASVFTDPKLVWADFKKALSFNWFVERFAE